MKRVTIVLASCAAVCLAGGDWGYHSHNGPENWEGSCQDGFKQSPIDIRASDVDYAMLHKMHFVHYDHSGPVNVTNNGHTVSVSGFDTWEGKQPLIQGGGLKHKYKLAQFHLHWAQHDHVGSEQRSQDFTIPPRYISKILHLVHVRADLSLPEALAKPDGLAVVGVFLTVSHDSAPIGSLSSVLENVIHPGNRTVVHGFRARPLIPAHSEAFYRYEGSLTTPGCNEAVIWTLLAEPISITRAQLKELRQLYEGDGKQMTHNYRPIQPLNGRRILYRPAQFDRSLLCGSSLVASTAFVFVTAIFSFVL